ncbi:MAG: DNA polymerase III subunit chi [Alphaproteobacteria bacterium]|nr:DNA polymerase III subunit chi [Alphaproteobacteria bacterium]
MTRVDFYHLQKWPLHKALPQLLEKVLASGSRAVVMAASPERVEALNTLLWTYDPASWLPHGSSADGNPDLQPVWLTDAEETPSPVPGVPVVLVLTDGRDSPAKAGFARCLDLFDGNDPAAVDAARARWRACREAGHEIFYWQQTDGGGWREMSRASET